MGLRNQEPVLLEAGERFTQRDLAYAELGRQGVLSDGGVSLESTGENSFPQELHDLVGNIPDF
jgi:hypothetical protein